MPLPHQGRINIQQTIDEAKAAIEKLEILDGTRNRALLEKSAVRIEDLYALIQMTPTMYSRDAASSDPVSKADFDALRRDVIEIYNRLEFISKTLNKKLYP